MENRNKKQVSSLYVALIVSLLAHQLFLTLIAEVLQDDEPRQATPPQRIMLVEVTKSDVSLEPSPEPKGFETFAQIPKTRPRRSNRVSGLKDARPKITPESSIEPWPEQALPPSGESLPGPPPRDVDTEFGWKSFEQAFEKEALADREAYEEASLNTRRGSGFYGRFSGKVQNALKTNKGWVVPGNQEPLGNRNEIFHQYIYAIHEKQIHPRFADGFWDSLGSFSPTHPLNDMSMSAWAEFEILASGHVNEVRLVKSSGNAVFDAAAVDSIYRSSPFPEPPREILSWNNRVYIRWGFFRSNRKCGVFNVEPYIIRAPDAEKEDISIKEYIDGQG